MRPAALPPTGSAGIVPALSTPCLGLRHVQGLPSHRQRADGREQGFHANNKTKRRFLPNLHTQRFWLENEKRFVRLRVSRQGLRIIDKKGIEQVVTELRAQGKHI